MSRHAKATHSHTLGAPIRGQGVISESEHDPYRLHAKLAEPAACPQCHAVFHEGRWQWTAVPPEAAEVECPACRREREHFPAGYVKVEGRFFQAHRAEIMALIKHRAERARDEHPMQRVMGIDDDGERIVVRTTETHLARAIGDALHDAYKGELEFHYEKGQELLRVQWKRES